MSEDGYQKFRGKCKELCEAAVAADPFLRLVRGHYYCPVWNTDEQHWWTVKEDGTIHDPTKDQFPSKGLGIYTQFDGTVECANCHKRLPEEDAHFDSRYAFCSGECWQSFIGL